MPFVATPLACLANRPISWDDAHYVIVASRDTAPLAREWGDALVRTGTPGTPGILDECIRTVAVVEAPSAMQSIIRTALRLAQVRRT
jgi:hypothetical protein